MGWTQYQGSISVRVHDVYDDDEWASLIEMQSELEHDLEVLEAKYAKIMLMIHAPQFT